MLNYSTSAPELGYVKESSNEQYVPDVFYKHKDEYGNDVTKIARPLPVEYLLVDVPVSTPKTPQNTFTIFANEEAKPFPIENRPIAGHLQDFNSLAAYLNQFPATTTFLRKACDLHFLVFIATMEIVHLREFIGPLLEAIRTGDEAKANDWAKSEHWATVFFNTNFYNICQLQFFLKSNVFFCKVEQLIAASSAGGGMADIAGGGHTQNNAALQGSWTCAHCTYHNVGNNTSCDVCQLPR